MRDLIKVTTQKIFRGQKAFPLLKRNSKNEFQKIINYTDKDQSHKKELLDIDPKLCRYKDIYPYKYNKVTVPNDHKYVNASWMHIFEKNSFIATQGPHDSTIEDFWTICFKDHVTSIIMLCNEIEDNKKKCSNYWDVNLKLKNFKIKECKIIETNDLIEEKLISVEFITSEGNKIKEFPHIQFKGWPDHKIPNIENYVPTFERLFKFADKAREKKEGHLLVHCSAGIGRTGVFLTLYAICHEIQEQIKKKNDIISFNVFNFVRKLKEMRMFSVENINQYNFIYRFLEEYLTEKNIPQNMN